MLHRHDSGVLWINHQDVFLSAVHKTRPTPRSHTNTCAHAPMMHISTFGCAALTLVQLHSMSLSPLPPSGWTVISTLLSGNAKLWIMDEVQVASDHSRALTWQTQWQTWQGQRASVFFSASSPPRLCPFATFFISMFIGTNQQDDTSLFISYNMIQTYEKLISLSKFSCLTASSDLTRGRQASLFAISFDLKTTHTMSVSIYE